MRVLVMIGGGPGAGAAVTLEAFAGAYYALRDAGMEVVLASGCGGSPEVARPGGRPGTAAVRFQSDGQAREALADTLRYEQVCVGDFDAVLGFRGDAGLAAQAMREGIPVALLGDCIAPPATAACGLLILAGAAADAARAVRALLAAATSPR